MEILIYFLIGVVLCNASFFFVSRSNINDEDKLTARDVATYATFVGWPIVFPALIILWLSIKLQKFLNKKFPIKSERLR